MNDLFEAEKAFKPLADRMRPRQIDHIYGQSHLLGKDKPLRQAIEANKLHSMLFWGPPGTGKTTIARLIAKYSDARFLTISAVLAALFLGGGVGSISSLMPIACTRRSMITNCISAATELRASRTKPLHASMV